MTVLRASWIQAVIARSGSGNSSRPSYGSFFEGRGASVPRPSSVYEKIFACHRRTDIFIPLLFGQKRNGENPPRESALGTVTLQTMAAVELSTFKHHGRSFIVFRLHSLRAARWGINQWFPRAPRRGRSNERRRSGGCGFESASWRMSLQPSPPRGTNARRGRVGCRLSLALSLA